MKKEIKYFASFLSPGLLVGKSFEREIKTNNPNEVEWPERAYAFTIEEREDVVDGTTRYKGEPKQLGPTYYHPDSRVETLEEVTHNPNQGAQLVNNMRCNGWSHIIWTRWDNWPQPYSADQIKILPKRK